MCKQTNQLKNRLQWHKNSRNGATKYTYDAAGNRETEQITTSTATGTQVTLNTYKYNEQNRLLSTTEETGDGTKKTTTYSYDPNGNMTKKSFEQTRQIDPSNLPTPKFGMYIEGQQDGATENAKTIAAGIPDAILVAGSMYAAGIWDIMWDADARKNEYKDYPQIAKGIEWYKNKEK